MGFGDLLQNHPQRAGNAPQSPSPPAGGRWVRDPLTSFLENGYEPDVREPGFHPSELYYLCPVKEAYSLLNPNDALECTHSAADLLTFAVGHAIHYWFQRFLLGPMGNFYGIWKCLTCGKIDDKVRTIPDKCGFCFSAQSSFSYEEIRIHYDPLEIVGCVDGLLVRDGELVVIDLKTIKPANYENLSEPSIAYIWQMNTYIGCLRHMGYGVDRGVIVYVNKGEQHEMLSGKKTLAIKEFEIEYSPVLWAEMEAKIGQIRRIRRIFDEKGATGLTDILKGLKGTCWSKNSWQAKKCAFSDACFSR